MDMYVAQNSQFALPTFFNVAGFPGPQPAVNYIVAGETSRYAWEGVNAQSVKMFFRGSAKIRTRDGKYHLEGDRYLALNALTKYAVTVRSETGADAISVFFRPGFAEEVAKEMSIGPERIDLFEHLFPAGAVTARLTTMRRSLRSYGNDPLWVEEQTRLLMAELLRDHIAELGIAERVPALRQSTKEDLYRRLLLAQDYAHSCYAEPVSLADLARVACLSPSYFLRAYRTVFDETPHQTLVRRRLERAQELLKSSRLSVQEICRHVGFVSLGSFSWLFRNRVGVPPQEYRRLAASLKTPA